MADVMVFETLSPIEVPVRLVDKDYILREASGDAAAKWRNRLLRSTKMGGSGDKLQVLSVEGLADNEPYLVSLCLFEKEGNKPVPMETVLSWPARVVKALFEKAKDISALDEMSDKNGQVKN